RCRVAAVAAACLALGGGTVACGDNDDDGGGGAAAPATTTEGGGASGPSQASIDTVLQFTGGTAGKADASLDPVVIAYANQEGGVPSFTEYDSVSGASVDLANSLPGGVDGHPLDLEECVIQSQEDVQKCGADFRGNVEISAVILRLAVVGKYSLFKTID